jgi:hypothetical protein
MEPAVTMTAPSLPLTLIPRTCWKQNVRTALPDQWDAIRHEVYRRSGHRCEACHSAGDGRPCHAHEYWQFVEGHQVLTHIACLCDTCHSATHLGRTRSFSGSDRAAREALHRLALVNGWTLPQAAAYARQELALCADRSKRQWKLDLSALAEYGVTCPSPSERRGAGWVRSLLGVSR